MPTAKHSTRYLRYTDFNLKDNIQEYLDKDIPTDQGIQAVFAFERDCIHVVVYRGRDCIHVEHVVYRFIWWHSGLFVSVYVYFISKVAVYCMYVPFMAFFAKVSDPIIGGTYMTLLNTICNLGSYTKIQIQK